MSIPHINPHLKDGLLYLEVQYGADSATTVIPDDSPLAALLRGILRDRNEPLPSIPAYTIPGTFGEPYTTDELPLIDDVPYLSVAVDSIANATPLINIWESHYRSQYKVTYVTTSNETARKHFAAGTPTLHLRLPNNWDTPNHYESAAFDGDFLTMHHATARLQ